MSQRGRETVQDTSLGSVSGRISIILGHSGDAGRFLMCPSSSNCFVSNSGEDGHETSKKVAQAEKTGMISTSSFFKKSKMGSRAELLPDKMAKRNIVFT